MVWCKVQFSVQNVQAALWLYCVVQCGFLDGLVSSFEWFASCDCRMRWDQTEVTNIVSWGMPNIGAGTVIIMVMVIVVYQHCAERWQTLALASWLPMLSSVVSCGHESSSVKIWEFVSKKVSSNIFLAFLGGAFKLVRTHTLLWD